MIALFLQLKKISLTPWILLQLWKNGQSWRTADWQLFENNKSITIETWNHKWTKNCCRIAVHFIPFSEMKSAEALLQKKRVIDGRGVTNQCNYHISDLTALIIKWVESSTWSRSSRFVYARVFLVFSRLHNWIRRTKITYSYTYSNEKKYPKLWSR